MLGLAMGLMLQMSNRFALVNNFFSGSSNDISNPSLIADLQLHKHYDKSTAKAHFAHEAITSC